MLVYWHLLQLVAGWLDYQGLTYLAIHIHGSTIFHVQPSSYNVLGGTTDIGNYLLPYNITSNVFDICYH